MLNEAGEISYRATQGILHSWGPSDSTLRAVILAFLTTVLSYQATATIIDLAFGTKNFGFAHVRDVQLLLLVRRQSPYAVARSLFERLPFSKLPNYVSRDPPGKLRPTVVFKLILLLFVAPVVNVAAIFLTLEFETDFTFKQSEFGGIAMAIDINSSREGYIPISQSCVRAPVAVGRAEIALSEFIICDSAGQTIPAINANAAVGVQAVAGISMQVFLSVPFSDESFFSVAHIVNTDPEVNFAEQYNYRVSHAATNSSVEALTRFMMSRVSDFCGGGEVTVRDIPTSDVQVDAASMLEIPCDREDTLEAREWLRDLIAEVRTKIVFVDSENLRVIRTEDSQGDTVAPVFQSADSEKFLRRRNTYADIFIMLIFAFVMVIVRLFTRCVTRNDLPRGIGLIVRDELGIPCCDSMLPSKDVVARYSGLAHLGVRHGEFDDD